MLEPIQWNKYFQLHVPIPSYTSEAEFQQALGELQQADEAYAKGDDAAVFYHAYNAWDPIFYSQRDEILKRAVGADDDNKQGTIKAIIDVVHRFANGGRHLPESGASSGGFEVDHMDAEYVRGLTTLSVAYLAKRLQSRENH